jgi:hypothetical protein
VIEEDDFAMAALRLLPPHDVSAPRARRLRERCHRELRERTATTSEAPAAQLWRRVVGPALIGALSAIYLIETFRTAAALYGF